MSSFLDNLPASYAHAVCRFAEGFAAPFQKASMIRYFTFEFLL